MNTCICFIENIIMAYMAYLYQLYRYTSSNVNLKSNASLFLYFKHKVSSALESWIPGLKNLMQNKEAQGGFLCDFGGFPSLWSVTFTTCKKLFETAVRRFMLVDMKRNSKLWEFRFSHFRNHIINIIV